MAVTALLLDTHFALERLPHYFRLKNLGRRILKPLVSINFENKYYQVKTITSADELAQVLRLRFEVFFQEFSTRKIRFQLFPYDVDMHDFICDHLVVKDKETGKIVACYRLLSSTQQHRIDHYYSEGEFQMEEFLKLPGKKLELGRACVHKDYRSGAVIALLWKGLCEYAKKSGTRYMFGCSSINRKDFEKLPLIMKHLMDKNSFIEGYEIGIQKKYALETHPQVQVDLTPATPVEGVNPGKAVPSLMNMYLLAGAKMSKKLAYDGEMDCLDILTVLDFTELPPSFERRFAC